MELKDLQTEGGKESQQASLTAAEVDSHVYWAPTVYKKLYSELFTHYVM